ncbi:hypothetical protein Taro_007707 [Colocasia esculenta]|uniref:Uncharacterized protein n=1 Tax=Colocasia esculenta TaxID=4460 RepID=A0A843TW56_COLES|nr:hypothetical protein [Colocasia esculenta]
MPGVFLGILSLPSSSSADGSSGRAATMNIFKKKTSAKGIEKEIGALQLEAMYASTSISVGMKGASKAMDAMNKKMEPAKQAKVVREFQKQSTQMDMTADTCALLGEIQQGHVASTSHPTAGVAGQRQQPPPVTPVALLVGLPPARHYLPIEMMSEAIDETLDKDEVEEETEELTNQAIYCSY